MKSILSILLILLNINICYARIGDTVKEANARYGKSYDGGTSEEGYYWEVFKYNDCKIECTFLDDKCEKILYKDCKIDDDAIQVFLKANSQEFKWFSSKIKKDGSFNVKLKNGNIAYTVQIFFAYYFVIETEKMIKFNQDYKDKQELKEKQEKDERDSKF